MKDQTAVNIIKSLVKENKELKERLDVVESILHTHLPVITGEDDES